MIPTAGVSQDTDTAVDPMSTHEMSIWRVLLSIVFPPLAVLDQGCGSIVIVTLLTLAGWVPGVLAAFVILTRER